VVVAVEHGLLGTAHDQAVEPCKLLAAGATAPVAKIREREVQSVPVEREVGPDPKCEIGRQGDDPVQDARVVRSLDGGGEVAREERAVVRIVAQNLPFEFPKVAASRRIVAMPIAWGYLGSIVTPTAPSRRSWVRLAPPSCAGGGGSAP